MDNANSRIREEGYQSDDSTSTAGYIPLKYALKILRNTRYSGMFWGLAIGIILWIIIRVFV